MVGVPADTPVTTPVVLTVASAVLLLDQVPPVGELESAVVKPAHTVSVPLIADGVRLTVTVLVVWQPVGST